MAEQRPVGRPRAFLPQPVHVAPTGADRRPHVRTSPEESCAQTQNTRCLEPPRLRPTTGSQAAQPGVLREREGSSPPLGKGNCGGGKLQAR